MKTIRRGVFETNSSSTHSLSMFRKEEFDKFKREEVLIHKDKFFTKEQAIENLKNDRWFDATKVNWGDEPAVNNALKRNGYMTYEQYMYEGDIVIQELDGIVGVSGYTYD